MNFSSAISSAKPLAKVEQAALVNLLADDDASVHRAVRKKILSFGPSACEWLRPHALSDDPVLRRHALEILAHFDRLRADTRFLGFCLEHGEQFDLEQAAWLLAQTSFPAINVEGYRALLDHYAADLRERIQTESSAGNLLKTFNSYLFRELGFSGNTAHYYEADNSYLNRVLDRRTGNPITLTLLYMLLARRLNLPVVGIGLPGHFICRYQSTSREIYIDPFNDGQLLDKADCVRYLQNGNYSLNDDFLAPVSARRMFLRICGNLHQIYVGSGKPADAARFQHYLVALAR
jgi:regulator of sirC expression with transglutaminase-like and TPR domain